MIVNILLGVILFVLVIDLIFDLHKQNKDKGHNNDPPLGI